MAIDIEGPTNDWRHEQHCDEHTGTDDGEGAPAVGVRIDHLQDAGVGRAWKELEHPEERSEEEEPFSLVDDSGQDETTPCQQPEDDQEAFGALPTHDSDAEGSEDGAKVGLSQIECEEIG